MKWVLPRRYVVLSQHSDPTLRSIHDTPCCHKKETLSHPECAHPLNTTHWGKYGCVFVRESKLYVYQNQNKELRGLLQRALKCTKDLERERYIHFAVKPKQLQTEGNLLNPKLFACMWLHTDKDLQCWWCHEDTFRGNSAAQWRDYSCCNQ